MKSSNHILWSVMQMFITIALLLLASVSVKGQDLIVTQTGETIKAYRTDVGEKMVYYQLEDVEESPVMKIQKVDVLVVKLQSGEVFTFQEKPVQSLDAERPASIMIMPPAEPVADPEMIAHAKIGSLVEFYDGTKGVVFYLDGTGHGLAVYPFEDISQKYWQGTSFWTECVDIDAIPNVENLEFQMGLGSIYCDAAIKQLGLEELPAIKWCRSIAPDWYLPSLGELYELMVVANLSKGSNGPISQAIKASGGNSFAFKSNVYLSSSENDNTKVFAVFSKGAVKSVKKYSPHACRAIRMF